ncbi:hypothetical protein F5Y12DRAFT_364116 [Xylaria sp. FL1777]|nr:hypothetical protein F5Y12DRAFT_364116 [Xylaria sp. FL1777]
MESNASREVHDADYDASRKDDESTWGSTYAERTIPHETTQQMLSYNLANECGKSSPKPPSSKASLTNPTVSFASNQFAELFLCIDLLEWQFSVREGRAMFIFLESFAKVTPLLYGRIHTTRALLLAVQQYCDNTYIRLTIKGLQIDAEIYSKRLDNLSQSIVRYFRDMRAHVRRPPEPDIREEREEEVPRVFSRPRVTPTPWFSNRTRRMLCTRRLSCDLRRTREGKGYQK